MKNCFRMKRIALKHEPQRKNTCAGRMIRRKKASRERAWGVSPGAAMRASFGAERNAEKVSAHIAIATQKKTVEKNRHPSSSSFSKYLVRKGIRVIEK